MKFRPLKLLPLAMALAAVPMFAHGEDLLDAYHQAVANSPVLAQQLAQRNITGENVPLAWAPLLPHLSAGLELQQFNGGATTLGTGGTAAGTAGSVAPTASIGHTRRRTESITLTQTILDFSKYANLSAAKASRDSANALYQANLDDLMVRVTQAYFNVLTSKDQVQFAKANVDALKRQYEQAEQRFKVGLSAITDVQDAKASYDSALANLYVARNELHDAREALTQITGHPTEHLDVLVDELPMAPPSPSNLSTWVTQAKLNNPNILAQQFNVEAADHSVTAARDARLPTINANVSYGKTATWYENNFPGRRDPGSASIGLTLSVPLFSGGAIHANISKSIYQRDAAQAALVQQRRQVVRNTRNYYRSVISGISQVNAAKQAVVSSKSALKATQAGFLVGTQTIVNVLLAQEKLTQARQQYSLARHQLILNKLLLKQAAGALQVQDLKLVNALLKPASAVQDFPANMEDGAGDNPLPAAPATSGNATG
ncbi:MAG TPA: TolC family outer membrane protein [Oleiagrimonas sp.]|nr:TolC family outer membrane protein [Oleiagrimonas sp.]